MLNVFKCFLMFFFSLFFSRRGGTGRKVLTAAGPLWRPPLWCERSRVARALAPLGSAPGSSPLQAASFDVSAMSWRLLAAFHSLSEEKIKAKSMSKSTSLTCDVVQHGLDVAGELLFLDHFVNMSAWLPLTDLFSMSHLDAPRWTQRNRRSPAPQSLKLLHNRRLPARIPGRNSEPVAMPKTSCFMLES